MDLGVAPIERETFHASMALAQDVAWTRFKRRSCEQAATRFRAHDEDLLRRQHAFHYDEKQMIATAREAAAELERVFEQDAATRDTEATRADGRLRKPR